MYMTLAIAGSILGLVVTGAVVFTVWRVLDAAKSGDSDFTAALRRWTVMDAAAVLVFVIGSLLLLSDLLAVMRDRSSYPYYHYGYLFVAFILMVVGMLVMVTRLAVVLRPRSASADQRDEPAEADETKDRIEGS